MTECTLTIDDNYYCRAKQR